MRPRLPGPLETMQSISPSDREIFYTYKNLVQKMDITSSKEIHCLLYVTVISPIQHLSKYLLGNYT